MFTKSLLIGLFLSIFGCSVNEITSVPRTKTTKKIKLEIKDEDSDIKYKKQREQIKDMMKVAWEGYRTYAWGKNEVKPLREEPYPNGLFGDHDLGLTIIESMDTLYIMGLKSEYRQARQWVKRKLSMNIDDDFSVSETTIRFIGGLLSMYSFTGDELYKVHAQIFADKLMPAFKTRTGIPYALVNFKRGLAKNHEWARGSILSELGTLHLEFTYLSDITGNNKYHAAVDKIRKVLKKVHKPNGLYSNFINPDNAKWVRKETSLGDLGGKFYGYLLKAWIQSDKEDGEARYMYDKAMKAIEANLVQESQSGSKYFADWKNGRLQHRMDHMACFAGGMFALGATTKRHMELGKEITTTCHESYVKADTMLGPEVLQFDDENDASTSTENEKIYLQWPETVESYLILWRLTKNKKYRDWGWEVVQALEHYSRTPNGFVGLKDVYDTSTDVDDVQQSYFLARTLKYLYLLYCDDNVIPLDKWVLNSGGHPLPIKNKNPFYRHHVSDLEFPEYFDRRK